MFTQIDREMKRKNIQLAQTFTNLLINKVKKSKNIESLARVTTVEAQIISLLTSRSYSLVLSDINLIFQA
jgi:hypothetical protein